MWGEPQWWEQVQWWEALLWWLLVVGVLVGGPLATIGASNWWQRRQDALASNKPRR